MCRFLIAQSDLPFLPKKLLASFAEMAKKSKAFDGDWQGDGWGVAWLNDRSEWTMYRSLKPVWEDQESFTAIPETTRITIHARSASFPSQKGVIEYNQPYINDEYSFVFNGFLKNVTLPNTIPGKIGAEKIWWLLQNYLRKYSPEKSLERIKELLLKHTSEIQALNIGLSNKQSYYSLNYFTKHPQYYKLHKFQQNSIIGICSEQLQI